jgi:hypothetical protein
MNDSEFERMLLQSAHADGPRDDARDAWARLSGSLSTMGPGGMIGEDGRRGPEGSTNPVIAPGPVWPGAGAGARSVAMKWLLLGAIGGSAVTAAVVLRARPGETSAPATVVVPEAIAPAKVSAAAGTPSGASAPDVDPTPIPMTSLAARAVRPRHAGRGRDLALQDAADRRVSESTLAAEVSRIDAARTANAGGAYDEAIWLIERYQRDFADGALAPDAEVVALEAVAAKRDRPETARRAALFLSRYPDDPHAARVKWLAEHRGTDQQ